MENKRGKVRISRMLAMCVLVAVLLCATSAITFAATDGETANPITAIKVYINGQEANDRVTENQDGSLQIEVNGNEDVNVETKQEASDSSMQLKTGDLATEKIDVNTKINPDSDEVHIEISGAE